MSYLTSTRNTLDTANGIARWAITWAVSNAGPNVAFEPTTFTPVAEYLLGSKVLVTVTKWVPIVSSVVTLCEAGEHFEKEENLEGALCLGLALGKSIPGVQLISNVAFVALAVLPRSKEEKKEANQSS